MFRSGGFDLETAQELDSEASSARRTQKGSNPFKVPESSNYFLLREQERERRERNRVALQVTSIENRAMDSRRQNLRNKYKIKPTTSKAEERALSRIILEPEKGKTKTDLRDFVAQKREIFLSQLAIDTKREELQRLQRLEVEEEKNLKEKEAEINLFKTQFTNFLNYDGKQTMLVRREADDKAKESLEYSIQIKQLMNEITSIRRDNIQQEERLAECEQYKIFLDSLTPESWKKEHKNEMYFKKPEQLLTIINTMEDQNMFLIRHCQEAEEMVEKYRHKFSALLDERDGKIEEKTNKYKIVSQALEREKQKKAKYVSNRDFKTGVEISDKERNILQQKIAHFYGTIWSDSASTSDTLAMLVKLENLMQELYRDLLDYDPVVVKKRAQEKYAERREKQRIENQKRDKEIQNEKRQRTLAQAKLPIKYKTGRPVIARSIPKRGISKQEQEEKARKEELNEKKTEELLFGDIWD